jgi:hypothetical protein
MTIFNILRERELGANSKVQLTANRECYSYIHPNSTIFNLEPDQLIPRKFSPDGKYLVCFAQNQHSIQVFKYHLPSKCTKSQEDSPILPTWNDYFTLEYEKVLTSGQESLSNDFCLFTTNKRHMILASAIPTSTPPQERIRNPDSLSGLNSLDDITFHVLDIETGNVFYINLGFG